MRTLRLSIATIFLWIGAFAIHAHAYDGWGWDAIKLFSTPGSTLNPETPSAIVPQGAGLEPYGAPSPAAVQQPPASDGTYVSGFDGKRYDAATGKEIVKADTVRGPSSSSSSSSTSNVPFKLNSNINRENAVTLGSTAPPVASTSPATNPYRYQSSNNNTAQPAYTGFGQAQSAKTPTVQNQQPLNDRYGRVIGAVNAGMSPTAAWSKHVGPQLFGVAGVTPRYTVGGISLSKAAAERMALNVDIEGVALRDGQFILAGSRNNTTRLDAALFLTALRTACSSRDPYFSLDPPNGAAWSEQGSMASKAVWNRVQNELNKNIGGGFEIQSFSVKQRYPALWAELAPEFPELRSRLVFQPEWLRETRFGEILYKADVLLKELTTGVSLVKPGVPLRANEIAGYVPAGERRAIRDFLTNEAQRTPEGMRGHRLWFDLMPDASANATTPQHVSDLRLNQYKLPGLYPILERRGLIGGRAPSPIQNAAFSSDGDIVDLSRIYPKMFVRRHDHASGKDIMDVDVEYERASNDVNERSALYANAYQELRDLADIFRAYVASVKIAKESPKVCGVASIPLTEGEKVSAPLPEFHPTEIVLTAAQYAWRDSRARHWQLITGSTISGGISLRGKEFFAAARADRSTSVTVAMKQDLADGIPAPSWDSTSGRRYMAFNIDPREPPRRVPITAENSTK